MTGPRYEEYADFAGGLPFRLSVGLERTLYTSSRGQNWHEEPELQFCTGGEGTVLIGGERYDFRPGDIAAVGSGVIHRTGTEGRLTYTCLIISAAFCRQVGIECEALCFEPHFRDEALEQKLCALCEVYAGAEPFRTAKLHELLLGILIALAERHAVRGDTPAMQARSVETVKAVIRHIRENYAKKLTLDELARAVCTDKYALCREFRHFTGQTIVTYINHYRCIMAAGAIASGCAVAEAAHLCGFESASFFTRTFKKYMGVLPSQSAGRQQV